VQVSRAEQEAVVERFLAAVRGGDLQELLDVLAPDVVVVSDGGGEGLAARPFAGAGRVVTLLGRLANLDRALEVTSMWLNGGPAVRFDLDGELRGVASLVIEDGRITRIFGIANPHKLARLDEVAELSR
jgi:RNA polymerase sigma-70 factor (ECF subfamily)